MPQVYFIRQFIAGNTGFIANQVGDPESIRQTDPAAMKHGMGRG